jgi:hypothetical protein
LLFPLHFRPFHFQWRRIPDIFLPFLTLPVQHIVTFIQTPPLSFYWPLSQRTVSLPRYAAKFPVSGFLSFLESRPVKMGPTGCPETSVNNYHTTPCNYPKDHRLHQHRGGILKSRLHIQVLFLITAQK